MKNIKLNNSTQIDLQNLIDTRLLVQANSGGGKSWLLRRLLEQSHGQVQQIVIDLEGEFSTLREKFDYILAGKDGDTPADPRSASLLARKLLELNVSAIIDLYELDHYERKRFVKLFLDSLVDAPKNLWHPCIVVIDEAHVFCPEKGQSEAMGSVIDLATRGRKRGFCAVLATQRLSKLHKDAAAECNNKLIGRTGLDVDMKRASEELGFTSKEDYLSMRSLAPGEFFAFGPAISTEVKRVQVGEVQTTHPKAGSRELTATPTPPTSKIKALLPRLEDLPKEAQEEAKTINDFKVQVANLKRELTLAQRQQPQPSQDQIDNAVKQTIAQKEREYYRERTEWQKQIESFFKVLEQIGIIISKEFSKHPSNNIPGITPVRDSIEPHTDQVATGKPTNPVRVAEQPGLRDRRLPQLGETNQIQPEFTNGDKPITGGALRMLQVLVSRYPMKFSKAQLATFSKLSPRSGTYGTYLSLLRSQELIEVEGSSITASQKGLDFIGSNPMPPQTSEEVIQMWRENLSGGARRMFEALVEYYPDPLDKERLGEVTELEHTSGTFGTYLSMLRSNGLVEVNGSGIKASENLFI